MKKLRLYFDKFWKKIAAAVTAVGLVLTGVSQFDKVQNLFKVKPDVYVEQINQFLEGSKIEDIQVIENDLGEQGIVLFYSTVNFCNCDYTSRYVITSNKDFTTRRTLSYADNVVKNQFMGHDGVFYSRTKETKWKSPQPIPLPNDLPVGEHVIDIIFYFKCSKAQKRFKPQAILSGNFNTF